MKLSEPAIKVNSTLEHSQDDLIKVKEYFLSSGKLLQNIEGNKFKLIIADNTNVGLFTSDGKFVGYTILENEDENILSIKKILIVPEFRNQKIAKIFLYWLKASLKKSVFIGGAIFKDGQDFVKSVIDDPRFSDDIVGFNFRTKEKFKLDLNKFFDNKGFIGILIEQLDNFYGMFDNSLPGEVPGSRMICLEMFADNE